MSEFSEFVAIAPGGIRRAKNLTGKKFGNLTAISPHSRSRNGHYRWICKCKCGNTKDVLATHLVSGKTKSCGCGVRRHQTHKQWTGYGGLSGRAWGNILRGANQSKGRKAIEFDLTIKQAWNLFRRQQGLCALSGVPIQFAEHFGDVQTASLDRIDSSKGYTIKNVQWVHKDINKMKNNLDQAYFISLCKLVAGECEL